MKLQTTIRVGLLSSLLAFSLTANAEDPTIPCPPLDFIKQSASSLDFSMEINGNNTNTNYLVATSKPVTSDNKKWYFGTIVPANSTSEAIPLAQTVTHNVQSQADTNARVIKDFYGCGYLDNTNTVVIAIASVNNMATTPTADVYESMK